MFRFLPSVILAGLAAAEGPVPSDSRQLIVLVTPDRDASRGSLYRFERDRSSGPWHALGEPWGVLLGERGLAAGLGLHRGILPRLPLKAEGDGRSPAGVFELSHVFGFAPRPPGLRMPYLELTEDIECVDDVDSQDYGRILRRGVAAAWTSSEKMAEVPGYEWGVVVAHNRARRPSAGSCIFLHARMGEKATRGCTALEMAHLKTVVEWLDESREPVLVQLTEDLYRDLSIAWELPEAPVKKEPEARR